MLNFKEIVDNSGDSILENYHYSDGILVLIVSLTELEIKIKIRIKTDCISFSNYYLNMANSLYKTCRIEIDTLMTVLLTENKIYVPSINFGKFMNETKSNYNLAYGKNSSEQKYLFSLTGYDRLISCLLSDLTDITIEEIPL